MKNRSLRMLLSAMALMTASAVAALPASARVAGNLGPHADRCAPGSTEPALLLTITGFKDHVGQVRVKAYSGEGDDFLKSGKYLVKFDARVPAQGDMTLCVPLPGNHASYAVSVLHDRDMDGKTDLWSDGFGVSNNPKLKFAKPETAEAAFTAPKGVGVMRIVLNYVSGLSVKPIRESE